MNTSNRFESFISAVRTAGPVLVAMLTTALGGCPAGESPAATAQRFAADTDPRTANCLRLIWDRQSALDYIDASERCPSNDSECLDGVQREVLHLSQQFATSLVLGCGTDTEGEFGDLAHGPDPAAPECTDPDFL